MSAYERLAARFARMATVDEAAGILMWDAETMMPEGGSAARGEHLAVLAGLTHEMMVAPATADDLAAAEAAGPGDDPWLAANLALMRRAHTRATAVPGDLVEATVRATITCEAIWRDAHRTADFALVRPALEEVLRLTRQQGEAIGAVLGLSAWDAMADGAQRGILAADIAPVFEAYQTFLRHALPRAEALQAARPAPLPLCPVEIPLQEALARKLMAGMGLAPTQSRLDSTMHPFCGGLPGDVRIAGAFNAADPTSGMMALIHETGHGLYTNGLPAAWLRQPVGMAAGAAVHESQSLIMEMQAGRSQVFVDWMAGEMQTAFAGDAAAYAPENLGRLWRRATPSLIRVDADELTYPAHVILRFRLEQALFAGSLDAAGLPTAWNDGMQQLLGVTPPNDREGVLQDIHWYVGIFGYFPSYSLGAMAAAQLMAAARRAEPGLDAALGQGDFSPLLTWLKREIHARGNLLGFNELLRAATGKPLDPTDFTTHLTQRYLI